MNDLLLKLTPVIQIYKAETAVIGFSVASAIGIYLGWQPAITTAVATFVGYVLAYLRTR